MTLLTKALPGVCGILLIGLLLTLHLYGGLKDNYRRLSSQFAEQVAINKDYQERTQKLHELDTRHTQELANAKTEIDRLRVAADRNPERVYIRASCSKIGSDTATGMDDAATARPTDTAIRNYWLLRERIAESKQMIKGLQGYINTQCVK
ncbi:lysis protein [Morganella sp. GD04133]|uniref:lysis protein n=1 Tax=Morganella sp. GD04133 TaxID=2975435 RepID=UPI00244844D7|nr:lysis protein [Morganella sp. GD04133]MDH0355745.1 lysis protein [Morganella sp. GD04133]